MIGLLKVVHKNMRVPGGICRSRIAALLVLSISLLPKYTIAQEADPDSLLTFRFLKTEVELAEPGTYFNVLEIKNNHREPVSGMVRINCPNSWRFIGPAVDTLTLQTGESKLIPVRISIPGSTLGGVSFVIGAELFGEDLYTYANSYISIKRRSRWEMRLSNTQVYFSDYKSYGEFFVSLDNSGNSDELVKLTFDMGGWLEFRDEIEADSFLYVNVPAYRDTTLRFQIQSRKDLTYAQSESHKSNWRARSLYIKASTTDHSASGLVRTTPLKSSVVNNLPFLNSPLNVEVTVYNLLAQQKKKVSTRVFGKILFPEIFC